MRLLVIIYYNVIVEVICLQIAGTLYLLTAVDAEMALAITPANSRYLLYVYSGDYPMIYAPFLQIAGILYLLTAEVHGA